MVASVFLFSSGLFKAEAEGVNTNDPRTSCIQEFQKCTEGCKNSPAKLVSELEVACQTKCLNASAACTNGTPTVVPKGSSPSGAVPRKE